MSASAATPPMRWTRAFQLAARWLAVAVAVLLAWTAAWSRDRVLAHPLWGAVAVLLAALAATRWAHRSWKVAAAFVVLAAVVLTATVLALVSTQGEAR